MKRCRTCGRILPDTEFWTNHATCKDCVNEKRRKKLLAEPEYAERIKAKSRKYWQEMKKLGRSEKRVSTIPNGMRVCRSCGAVKKISQFAATSSGRRHECKECERKRQRGIIVKPASCRDACPKYPCFRGIDTIETINPYICHNNPNNYK